jgi:pyruvate kinase
VVHGGALKDCKGMNLPGVNVSAPAMTEKDWEDTRFALGLGVDYLALSFVRRAAHVTELQEFVKQSGAAAKVIAKIEMPEALEEIDAILEASDSIMVARGDLGVELPLELVPIAQRQLVVQARARHRPVIVATQMLESMIEHPRPTRAEVSDVSTAVFAGADAVMLSAETASGAYPIAAVEVMDRVARQVEACLWADGAFGALKQNGELEPPLPFQPAIARTISQLSRDLRVRTVVVHSQSGATANVASAARPAAPVVAASALAHTSRQMNLQWGVIPVQLESAEPAHELAPRLARQLGLAETGQYVLALGGVGDNSKRKTPIVTVTALLVE